MAMVQAVAAGPGVSRDEVSPLPDEHPPGRLLGRSRERDEFGRLLTRIRSGRSVVLVVRGEAGIGKTALLEQLIEDATGYTVAGATGVPAHMGPGFAGQQQFFASTLGPSQRLAHPQHEAVE